MDAPGKVDCDTLSITLPRIVCVSDCPRDDKLNKSKTKKSE
jgi:hypothetical protein